MAIFIRHRFIDRLSPTPDFKFINTVVIGTFNPGVPDKLILTQAEKEEFETIEHTVKFRKFNSVMNFYDRPPNRFWGVMDRIYNSAFYSIIGLKNKNLTGLKYFVGSDREVTFKLQQDFCIEAGLFITDIVKDISPKHFGNIYKNFPDTQIEASSPTWNTQEIISTIKQFKPKRILINFRTDNKSIPTIAEQASKIKNTFPSITFGVLSTSGAAGNNYMALLEDWGKHIEY